ncbi:MAG: FGGY-family carbohydrate kinase [Phycisphaerae bacterium]|jgi:xylulokinase
MPAILTFDLGTTYFKAALFDDEGRLRGLHRLSPLIRRSADGWAEIEPRDFLMAIGEAAAALKAADPDVFPAVEAVTFATQTNSFLLLGPADEPLTPIILWSDLRAADLAREVEALSRLPGFTARTGLPAVGVEFLAAKMPWLHRHRPEVAVRARRLCLISDFLTLYLTGCHVTDAGAAGLTGLLDVHALRWWPESAAAMGVDPQWLPEVLRTGSEVGRLRLPVARELGLPAECRFIIGCLDQYAGAIGAGSMTPDSLSETTGTVLATVRLAPGFMTAPPPGVFQGPSFDPGRYFRMCFGGTSARLLEWLVQHLPDPVSFTTLDDEASAVEPGSAGLRVRPDAVRATSLADGFVGWTAQRTRGQMARAIMEAVAYALAGQVAALCGGRPPSRVYSSGGAARSDPWLQIKADVLGVPVAAGICPEPTSLGVALLAGQARRWGRIDELAERWIQTRCVLQPDERKTIFYKRLNVTQS